MGDQLLLVCVGNTRTRYALVRDGQLEPSRVHDNADAAGLATAVVTMRSPGEDENNDGGVPVLMASVNPPVSDALQRALREVGRSCSRLGVGGGGGGAGRELPIPIAHTLEDPVTVGPDRLLDALGAFSRCKQACIVIDAGTAITVDFVDGEGTFHGGAIAPGLRMMAAALHERTAALPLVNLSPAGAAASIDQTSPMPTNPDEHPFGKNTAEAITVGILGAARGLAHLLIDRYADFYGAYPRVIATGGDAARLFEGDELVERIEPDLQLVGMLEAYRRLEELEGDDGDPGPRGEVELG